MNHPDPLPLDPLPLDDVIDIVARRARRRQRLALGGTLGAGAVAAVVLGTTVTDSGPAPTSVVADGSRPATAPADTTPTTTPPSTGRPTWQADAAAYAVETVGFDYDDAVALADQWQVEPLTTKIVVGEALRRGTPANVDLLAAGEADAGEATDVLNELIDAFWSSGYDIGDAEQHGARWDTEVLDSKLLIGVRIATDQPVDG